MNNQDQGANTEKSHEFPAQQTRKKIRPYVKKLSLIVALGLLTLTAYAFDVNTVREIQLLLSLKGYDLSYRDSKGIDGKLGSKTLKAISEYKRTLPTEKGNNADLGDLKKILEDDIRSGIKHPIQNNENTPVPQEASHIDTLDKIIRILKPFQEEKELLFRYAETIDYVKFLGPIFAGIYLAGLAAIGYYFVQNKSSETKHDVFKYAQEQTNKANEVSEKARTDLEKAQNTYKEQEKAITDAISKVDNKLEQLSQNIRKIMDVRLTIGAISTNYYMAALNWRTGNIDAAIQGVEYTVSLIDSLDDDVNDGIVASKVKQTKASKQAIQSDLAYYYAQRYEEQKQVHDARCAIAITETMPEFIETLSGTQRISMIDNYLFIICKVKDVDKPHIRKFIEYYDNYKESLNTLLKHKDANILTEYSKFYEEVKAQI